MNMMKTTTFLDNVFPLNNTITYFFQSYYTKYKDKLSIIAKQWVKSMMRRIEV